MVATLNVVVCITVVLLGTRYARAPSGTGGIPMSEQHRTCRFMILYYMGHSSVAFRSEVSLSLKS